MFVCWIEAKKVIIFAKLRPSLNVRSKGLPTRGNIAHKISYNVLRATPCKVSYTLQCCTVASVQSCRVFLRSLAR